MASQTTAVEAEKFANSVRHAAEQARRERVENGDLPRGPCAHCGGWFDEDDLHMDCF